METGVNDFLPSLRLEGDDPRPVGFAAELTQAHIDGAAAVLEELASSFSPSDKAALHLPVTLCSARYVPGLPFQLYSFHIVSFDSDGNPQNNYQPGDEILYALIANNTLEVQREAALLFLYDLVFRQSVLHAEEMILGRADYITAKASADAAVEFRDRMRSGWREAARSLAARAHHDSISLSVRYRRDPFPSRDALVRRMPALREAYNSLELVKEFVDKVVSLVGGHDPRISVPGGSEELRVWMQRRLVEMGLRQYMTQTLRDAEVLGNGYLVLPSSIDEGPYNLKPEAVTIRADGRFLVLRSGQDELVEGEVIHAKGVEQFDSPYGFSVLEAVLPLWIARRSLHEVSSRTQAVAARWPDGSAERQELASVEALVQRHQKDSDKRIGELLAYPRDWIPEAVDDLYFPGQERM